MHPEFDKTRLLNLLELEYNFFQRTLALVPPERMDEPNVEGVFSVKDIIAHLTAWERRLLGWLAQAQRGETPSFPEPGYTPADVDVLNNRTYQEDRLRPLNDILDDFHGSHQNVVACIEMFPEADLFELHRLKGVWREPPVNLIIGNTSDHYLKHAQAIRMWIHAGS